MNGMSELARAIVGGSSKVRSSEHLATVVRKGADGTYWVKIPGGAEETPITSCMTEASEGDTVRVTISGGRSVMTGNVTSPSANIRTVTKVGGIANMAMTTAYSDSARIDRLVATTLTADSALINELRADIGRFNDLNADNLAVATAYIDTLLTGTTEAEVLTADKLKANNAKVMSLTADELNASVAYINALTGGNVTADNLIADHAAIAALNVDSLSAHFANIDLANINAADVDVAKIRELFARSGWFEDITVTGDGIITGKLTSVLVDGDTARFKNIYADALKLLGEDGLYHALNLAGLTEGEAQALVDAYGEDLEDGLHGSRIIAESITADKIDVTSLVAAMLLAQAVQIGATGGTHIEARGDRFSFFAGGYGYAALPDGYVPSPSSAMPGEVAYIAVDPSSGESTFYMTRSVVVKDLRFGNWMWYGRRNRNMSLKWMGA